tara:strand:- start:39 stop:491 length:453 start_codon:yes stop_codon:yes gene_type:complete
MKNSEILCLKAKMQVEIIFTFDSKPQQSYNATMRIVPVDLKESEWIKSLIELAFANDMHEANDLCKLSIAIGYKNKKISDIPMIKSFFARNGKYYFQPNQRDEVEEEIIKGTTIAKDTKKLQQTKEEFDREQSKNISLQEAMRPKEARLN